VTDSTVDPLVTHYVRRGLIHAGFRSAIAVALLAVALTVLSILFALPDRKRLEELRQTEGWRLLQGSLVAAAFFCLATVVFSFLGSAVDDAPKERREWLEQLVFASAVTGVLAILVSGGAFALILRAMRQAADDFRRGTGA
jgi:MFS family permease